MSDQNQNDQKPPRKRGVTSVMLGWIADRLRRAEDLKHRINSGTYQIDSHKIAESLVGENGQK